MPSLFRLKHHVHHPMQLDIYRIMGWAPILRQRNFRENRNDAVACLSIIFPLFESIQQNETASNL